MKNLLLLFTIFLLSFSLSAQYYGEDFESGIPADWTIEGAWQLGNSAAAGSQFFAPPAHTEFMYINDDDLGQGVDGDGSATSGPIDLTGATQPGLFMEAFFIDGDYGADETAKVFVSTDDGATWTEAASLGALGGWEQVVVPLTDYANQTIRLRFDYDDGDGWNYGFCFDDLLIDEVPSESISMTSADVNCALTGSQAGVELVVSGILKTNGLNNLTSIDFNYSDGTNTYTETVTGLDLSIGQSAQIEHPVTITSVDGMNNFDVWFSNPNGVEDPNSADNMASASVMSVSNLVEGRKVVVEEATGTWCTWCPRGAVYLDKMSECYPDHFIGIAVHNEDPMVLAAYDNAITSWSGFPGFPSVILERDLVLDPADIVNPTLTRAAVAPDALITNMAQYDETIRGLTVTLEVTMNRTLGGDYKLTGILTEDGLMGTGDDWAQVNAYSGGGQGPMGGYELLPSPVPAELMTYDHVGRALIGGFAGSSNSLPDTLFVNQSYRFTFPVHAIPATQNIENMHLIGVFTSPTGEIINAESTSIQEAIDGFMVSNQEVYINDVATVYPNPFSETLNISLNMTESHDIYMQVFNAIGQKMDEVNYGNLGGNQLLQYQGDKLDNGIYFFHIYVDDQLITKKVTLAR